MNKLSTLAICWIGIGDYNILFKDFYESFNRHFCNDCNKTFFVFTDQPHIAFSLSNCKIYTISNACNNRPFINFRKFFYLLLAEDQLINYDYVAYMNGNMICQKDVEICELMPNGEHYAAIIHPYEKTLPKGYSYNDKNTMANFNSDYDIKYKQAGWIVCKSAEFLKMANCIEGWFRIDKSAGADRFITKHDETYYNKYMYLHEHCVSKLKAAEYLCPATWPNAKNAKMIQLHKEDIFKKIGKTLQDNTQTDLYSLEGVV